MNVYARGTVIFSRELLQMQPSTAVIINNCYAHWILHWHPALRWKLFSRVVNPGNPAISRHVVRRQPPIALGNKNCRRKETKDEGKVGKFQLSFVKMVNWKNYSLNFLTDFFKIFIGGANKPNWELVNELGPNKLVSVVFLAARIS